MNDYTNKNYKHHIQMTKVNQPVYSLILAISEENGLEHCGLYQKAVDQEKFSDYLDELSIENKHEKIAILMDNYIVHKTPEMKIKMDELGIPAIYNVPYQPDLNPTEACFSKIKNYYRRKKLNMLVNEEEFDAESMIKESVNELTNENIRNCIKLSLYLINK